MEEPDKLPLQRVEVSLSNFNEVAIPHHLDLLRQHKANIIKYSSAGELARVRSEQMHARRVTSQLRSLLAELDALRRRVCTDQLPAFDRRTQRSRDLTLKAIVEYLGVIESSCKEIVAESRANLYQRKESSPQPMTRWCDQQAAASAASTDSVGLVRPTLGPHHGPHHDPHHDPHHGTDNDEPAPVTMQLQVDDHEESLREREAVLRGWVQLQTDVRALHDTWQTLQAAALAQREQVSSTEAHVEVVAENVQEARKSLSAAEMLGVSAYSVGGAALGALCGGPVGVLAGAKLGAAAALAGSLAGFSAARLLARLRRRKDD